MTFIRSSIVINTIGYLLLTNLYEFRPPHDSISICFEDKDTVLKILILTCCKFNDRVFAIVTNNTDLQEYEIS